MLGRASLRRSAHPKLYSFRRTRIPAFVIVLGCLTKIRGEESNCARFGKPPPLFGGKRVQVSRIFPRFILSKGIFVSGSLVCFEFSSAIELAHPLECNPSRDVFHPSYICESSRINRAVCLQRFVPLLPPPSTEAH